MLGVKGAVAAALILIGSGAQAADWVPVATDADGGAWGMDASDIRYDATRGLITLPVLQVRKDGTHSTAMEQFDCPNARIRILQEVAYDKQDRVLAKNDKPQPWAGVVHKTVGYVLYDAVCGQPATPTGSYVYK